MTLMRVRMRGDSGQSGEWTAPPPPAVWMPHRCSAPGRSHPLPISRPSSRRMTGEEEREPLICRGLEAGDGDGEDVKEWAGLCDAGEGKERGGGEGGEEGLEVASEERRRRRGGGAD